MTELPFSGGVRLPSHVSPPFRARQWSLRPDRVSVIFGGDAGGHVYPMIDWQGCRQSAIQPSDLLGTGDPFPAGMLGVATHWYGHALEISGSITPPGAFAMTLHKNGSPVPGLCRVSPGLVSTFSIGAAFGAAFGAASSVQTVVPIVVPVHLVEGDRLDLQIQGINAGVGFAWLATCWAAGWLYPAEVQGDAGSIRATQQDPGIKDPLGYRRHPGSR